MAASHNLKQAFNVQPSADTRLEENAKADPIDQAIGKVGLGPLADACGVRYQAVQKWRRAKRVPAERCVAIEEATEGRVTRYQLRPDVFGEAPPAPVQEAG